MTKKPDILYIFFGIHTANVVQLASKIAQAYRRRLAEPKTGTKKWTFAGNYASVIENGRKIRPYDRM